jgi:inosose dehydratase
MTIAHHSMTWGGWYRRAGLTFELETVLAEVKAAGYEGIELGGDANSMGPAAELRRKLSDAGLTVGAWHADVHATANEANAENYRRAMDYAAEVGVPVIAVCGGFLPEARRNTFAIDYDWFAESLAPAVEHALGNGQRLGFHPHLNCLVETPTELDFILARVPDCDICVDTGHLAAVRVNATDLVNRYPDKIVHVHLKDWSFARRKFAELGEGDAGFDFVAFFAALERIGFEGQISVERDDPEIPAIESARISRAFLQKIGV